MIKRDPINPTDDDARALAMSLLQATRFGALSVIDPETGAPYVARTALLWRNGALLTLISTLSMHTKALLANPACSALIGEPGDKGDPLTHPRMTLQCKGVQSDKAAAKATWLSTIPKAQLYYDFTDFVMMRLEPDAIYLNGGFGKAYRLTPDDLT